MSRSKPVPALTPEQQQELAAMAALDLLSPTEAATVPRRTIDEMRDAAWQLARAFQPNVEYLKEVK